MLSDAAFAFMYRDVDSPYATLTLFLPVLSTPPPPQRHSATQGPCSTTHRLPVYGKSDVKQRTAAKHWRNSRAFGHQRKHPRSFTYAIVGAFIHTYIPQRTYYIVSQQCQTMSDSPHRVVAEPRATSRGTWRTSSPATMLRLTQRTRICDSSSANQTRQS